MSWPKRRYIMNPKTGKKNSTISQAHVAVGFLLSKKTKATARRIFITNTYCAICVVICDISKKISSFAVKYYYMNIIA